MKLKTLPTLLLATVMFNIFQPNIYAQPYQNLTVSDVERFIANTAKNKKYKWKVVTRSKKVNPKTGKILQIDYVTVLRKNEIIFAYLDYFKSNSITGITRNIGDCSKKIVHNMIYRKANGKLVTIKSKERMNNYSYDLYCKS
ncbi:MAG: hypothetical protein WBB28_16010 [Crinalium sp.]